METIQIALASDVNYFPGLLVTSVSLAQHASRDVALVFNVLDGGIGKDELGFLREKLSAAHPHTTLKVFAVDAAQFADFPEWNGGSRMTYARLIVPTLMSDCDFVLYCDVDFFWTGDVAELWALRNARYAAQGCRDEWSSTLVREGDWYAVHGIDVDMSHYVCAGLLLINLKRFREEDLARKLMDFLGACPDVSFVDQSAINGVIRDMGILPPKWGRFARKLHGCPPADVGAIHFAGTTPWKGGRWIQVINEAHRLWYRCYADLYGISYRAAIRVFMTPASYWARRVTGLIVSQKFLCRVFIELLRVVNRGYNIPDIKEMSA